MRVLLVIALAACSAPRAAGPAWPRPSAHGADGGESLEPPSAARTISAAVVEDDRALERGAERPPSSPTVAPAAAPGVAPATQPGDEVPPTEEIVIEVDD